MSSPPPRIELGTVLVPSPSLLASDMGREKVFLDMDQARYFGINSVGREIFDRCDGALPLSDVCDQLLEEFSVDPETCRREVLTFARRLVEAGLLQVAGPGPA